MTLEELLNSGLLSATQRVRIFNVDHPMARPVKDKKGNVIKVPRYFIDELYMAQAPKKYEYEVDERGCVVYEYQLDDLGRKIPKRYSNGTFVYAKFNGETITDEYGRPQIEYVKQPKVKCISKAYLKFQEYKDFEVAYIYADLYKQNEDTCLVIQVHGGDY